MTYALNEVEGALEKAVMGAGFPVGHARAIAAAGVWLARRGFPVCEIVARAVAGGMRECAVERGASGATFRAARAAVDGPPAVDLLLAGGEGYAVTMQDADEPALVIGLAGVAATAGGVGIDVVAGEEVETVGAGGVLDAGAWARGGAPRTVAMRLHGEAPVGEATGLASRYDPAACGDGGWDAIAALAHRTYVPASEPSRMKGAGAGLIDND